MNQAIMQMQSSMKAQQNNQGFIVEDSAESLIRKLTLQGKKVKIISEDEEDEEESPE